MKSLYVSWLLLLMSGKLIAQQKVAFHIVVLHDAQKEPIAEYYLAEEKGEPMLAPTLHSLLKEKDKLTIYLYHYGPPNKSKDAQVIQLICRIVEKYNTEGRFFYQRIWSPETQPTLESIRGTASTDDPSKVREMEVFETLEKAMKRARDAHRSREEEIREAAKLWQNHLLLQDSLKSPHNTPALDEIRTESHNGLLTIVLPQKDIQRAKVRITSFEGHILYEGEIRGPNLTLNIGSYKGPLIVQITDEKGRQYLRTILVE
ncbi:MAG: hypothetical protein N3E49_02025 [Bacteroidia bacterium]|nr:hypothetical protein [Bacteroidia bacterium]